MGQYQLFEFALSLKIIRFGVGYRRLQQPHKNSGSKKAGAWELKKYQTSVKESFIAAAKTEKFTEGLVSIVHNSNG